MLVSTRRAIQYPNPTRADVPDIPAHFVNLINALDLDMPFSTGTLAARPASPAYAGQCYWATDTQLLYFWTGAAWISLAPSVSPALTGTPIAPTPAATDNSTAIATTAFVRTMLPPGVMMAYVGAAAPTGWLLCDGTAVSRTGANAALFAIIGTLYGVGDGSTTFNLPDLRGRVPVGKTSGGTFPTLGGTGGEETHVLTIAELASHSHTGTTGTESATHTHTFQGNALGAHSHYSASSGQVKGDYNFTRSGTGVGLCDFDNYFGAGGAPTVALPRTSSDSAGTPSGTNLTQSANHTHSFTSNTTGSGTAHNNLQPYQVVNYIIKT